MVKKLIYLGFCLFFVWGVFPSPVFSQSTAIDCYATLKAWKEDSSLRNFMATHNCYCPSPNSRPVCPPKSSPTQPPKTGSGLNPSQQMAVGIFGAMLQSVFSGMFDNLIGSPKSSAQDALRKQQEEEQRKQQEEQKKQAMKQWMEMQAQAEAKRLAEEAEKKKRGTDILAKASIGGGGIKMESIGGGGLAPLNWDTPRISATAAPSGQYDTSKFSDMERLLCAASFSQMGENAAKSGDLEGARFYGNQIDSLIQGLPTSIECKPSKDLVSTIDVKKAGELNRKLTEQARFYQQAMPKIEKLQDIETRLDEVKKKKEDAGQKIKELDKQIEEIKARKETANTPEKKAQEDDLLLAQAMALKADAEKQQQEAAESEAKLIKEKQGIEDELNKMKEKMQGGK